jgi:D-lactate dehydrogenase
VENSYQTLESVSFLLPSGTFINTADPDAENQFNLAEPELAAGLLQIREEIERDQSLTERLKKKFSIKNGLSYGCVSW